LPLLKFQPSYLNCGGEVEDNIFNPSRNKKKIFKTHKTGTNEILTILPASTITAFKHHVSKRKTHTSDFTVKNGQLLLGSFLLRFLTCA